MSTTGLLILLVVIIAIGETTISVIQWLQTRALKQRFTKHKWAVECFRHEMYQDIRWMGYEFPMLEEICNRHIALLVNLLGEKVPPELALCLQDVSAFRDKLRREYQNRPSKGIRSEAWLAKAEKEFKFKEGKQS